MRASILFVHLASAWLLWAPGAQAQDNATPITLDETLQQVEVSAPRMAVADARVAEAATSVTSARTLWQPTLDVVGVYTLNDEETTVSFPNPLAALAPYLAAAAAADPTLPDPTLFTSAPGTTLTTQLRHDVRGVATLSQPLWQPYAAPARRRAAAAVDAAVAGREVAAWDLREAAQTLFFDALRYDALAQAAGENADLARLAAERAESALALGAGSELDRDRAAVVLLGALQQVRSALAGRDTVRDALATVIGIDHPLAPVLPGQPDESLLADHVSPEVPTAEFALAQSSFTESERGVVRAGAIPVVMATGTVVAHRETTFAPDPVDWSVQLAAQWNLYDGGTRRADRARIDAGVATALADADAARDEASGELRRAWIAYSDAVARRELASEEVELAVRAHESAESAWSLGAASRLDVDSAFDRASAARMQLAVAEVDVLAAAWEIARLGND